MTLGSGAVLLEQPVGDVWKKIRDELNEDANRKSDDLATIKDWLKKQPHLPDELPDPMLMNFLRGTNYSLEKCKRKLDMYFTMRTACPEFFTKRDITLPQLSAVTPKVQGPPLPKVTPDGRRVVIIRGTHPNLDNSQMNEALKLAFMVGDIRLMEETEGVAGDIYILDSAVLGASLMTKLSPTSVKKFMICLQEAYPARVKQIHIVNTSPMVERFINFIKPFFKEKIRDRIHVHKDVKNLFEYVPKDMLPPEYGGDGPSMEELQVKWLNKIKEYKDWFNEHDSIKANEALRPGKPKNYDELFGIDGSFRQLAID